MSNLGIRTDASGTFGALTLGGVDKVTVGSDGIQAGSYAPDSITATELASGALTENSPVGIGYGPGAGGTVTQATSKSTSVTLNKPCGRITTHNAALAAGGSVSFIFNNSLLLAGDCVVTSQYGFSANNSAYQIWTSAVQAGQAVINVKNLTAGTLGDAIPIQFAVIKGAIS